MAAVIVAVSPGVRVLYGPRLAGPLRCGHRTVAGGEVIGLCRRLAVGVAGAQCDPSGREQEDRAGQLGRVEARGERLGAGAREASRALVREVAMAEKIASPALYRNPRSRWIDGRATFMIEESAMPMN